MDKKLVFLIFVLVAGREIAYWLVQRGSGPLTHWDAYHILLAAAVFLLVYLVTAAKKGPP